MVTLSALQADEQSRKVRCSACVVCINSSFKSHKVDGVSFVMAILNFFVLSTLVEVEVYCLASLFEKEEESCER